MLMLNALQDVLYLQYIILGGVTNSALETSWRRVVNDNVRGRNAKEAITAAVPFCGH